MTPLAQLSVQVNSLQRRVIHLENRLHAERVNYADLVVAKLRAIDLHNADMESIANGLNMSGATLRRRLGERGLLFRDLSCLERKRRCEAELKRNPRATCSELAEVCGYSDHQNLVRAFRTWFGVPLVDYKRSQGVPA